MEPALDAHAKPPAKIRALYKTYQKVTPESLLEQPDLVQVVPGQQIRNARPARDVQAQKDLSGILEKFLGRSLADDGSGFSTEHDHQHVVYEIPAIPGEFYVHDTRPAYNISEQGLYIYPSLFPPEVQLELLDRLLHRDVSQPHHSTNVHLFHHVEYPPQGDSDQPRSFFDPAAEGMQFEPIDAAVHNAFDIRQFWNKKLRWATLGGQYDWTNKRYPAGRPPDFPKDIKQLVEGIFPMKAEAAIVNLYSPGDTLSLHRDVSEECDKPLTSISIGCDAIFIVGLGGQGASEDAAAAIRLRSGDAVLMSGPSRYAWHGVPKVCKKTCPSWLREWPATTNAGLYDQWKGWMASKRVNLNVRQMFN